MKVISKLEIEKNVKLYIQEIKKGKIFVYPTDTIYGIGCDAKNDKAVNKIREIKQRESKPFSIIVPNKSWIKNNCVTNKNVNKWVNKLPGPYTLILRVKKDKSISSSVTNTKSLGIRIPSNWFMNIVNKSRMPFVTTSVNVSGQPHITSIDDLEDKIKESVDYIIDDGALNNPPSIIIDLTKDKEIIIKR